MSAMAFVNLWAKLNLSGVNTSCFAGNIMSGLALFSLVDSEVTVGTICDLKQISPKLQKLVVALGLWPADGWSGNTAPKVSGDPSAACCCGVSLGLESNAVGGNQILDSEGLCPACWHHSVMAGGGGSFRRLPS